MTKRARKTGALALTSAIVAAVLGAMFMLSIRGNAQEPGAALATPARPKLRKPYPFSPGEMMKYEVRFAKFPIYATVGDLTLTVEDAESETEDGTPLMKFKGEAISRGLLVSLFRIKVRDTFESYVSADDFGASATIKRLLEGKRKREQATYFLRAEKQLWFTDRDLAAPNPKTSVTKAKSGDWVTDMMSIIYYTRTLELNPGSSYEVPFCDNAQTYSVPVAALTKEVVKLDSVPIATIRLQPDIFFGKLFAKGGSMVVWITDDAYKIPVKFVMKTSYGTLSGELTAKRLMPLPPELKVVPEKNPEESRERLQ